MSSARPHLEPLIPGLYERCPDPSRPAFISCGCELHSDILGGPSVTGGGRDGETVPWISSAMWSAANRCDVAKNFNIDFSYRFCVYGTVWCRSDQHKKRVAGAREPLRERQSRRSCCRSPARVDDDLLTKPDSVEHCAITRAKVMSGRTPAKAPRGGAGPRRTGRSHMGRACAVAGVK